jgi:hypothetical protein
MNRHISRVRSRLNCAVIGSVFDLFHARFPRIVRIETTNACNAACTICPHRMMTRPVKSMSEALFRRVADECAAEGCREVHLHNFGEPLLDRDLPARIRYIKAGGHCWVKVFTNGSLLTSALAAALVDAGLDELKVSLDGVSAADFERVRPPLRYAEIAANVAEAVRVRDARQGRMRIIVTCVSSADRRQSTALLGPLAGRVCFSPLHDWAHGDRRGSGTIRKPCSRLWRTLTVLSNGDISLCCMDFDGQVHLGCLETGATLKQIWRDRPYRAVRRLHRRAQQDHLPLCAACVKAFW